MESLHVLQSCGACSLKGIYLGQSKDFPFEFKRRLVDNAVCPNSLAVLVERVKTLKRSLLVDGLVFFPDTPHLPVPEELEEVLFASHLLVAVRLVLADILTTLGLGERLPVSVDIHPSLSLGICHFHDKHGL